MTRIAHGADQVDALEQALGGEPPSAAVLEGAVAAATARLQARHDQRQQQNSAARAASRSTMERLLDGRVVMSPEERDRQQAEAVERHRRRGEELRPPAAPAVPAESQFIVGSTFAIKTPPYGTSYSWGSTAGVSLDSSNGTYRLAVQSFGDWTDFASASLGTSFYAINDEPHQRFAALMYYSYDYDLSAQGLVAHSDLRTYLTVTRMPDYAEMARTLVQPQWSIGASWFDSYSGTESDITASPEVYFPAQAGTWYSCVLTTEASVDADYGPVGFSSSTIHFSAEIRDLFFGSLF